MDARHEEETGRNRCERQRGFLNFWHCGRAGRRIRNSQFMTDFFIHHTSFWYPGQRLPPTFFVSDLVDT